DLVRAVEALARVADGDGEAVALLRGRGGRCRGQRGERGGGDGGGPGGEPPQRGAGAGRHAGRGGPARAGGPGRERGRERGRGGTGSGAGSGSVRDGALGDDLRHALINARARGTLRPTACRPQQLCPAACLPSTV